MGYGVLDFFSALLIEFDSVTENYSSYLETMST